MLNRAVDGSTWIAAKEGRVSLFPSPTLTVNSSYAYNAPGGASAFDLSWNDIPCASSYTITYSAPYRYTVTYTGPTTATLYGYNDSDYNPYTLTVTANGACGASSVLSLQPRFLAGSIVHLADGSQKAIEEIIVGDLVIGAFGEVNPVLALHRPLLGSARMIRINGEHSTTAHHPHVSIDRGFYCADPATVEQSTYGHEHDVIDGSGVTVKRMLHGLKKGRVLYLERGVVLKTIEGGRPVSSIETYSLDPETQLYNLVTGGSHTYHVDGYAVTGWPREDDWDYDMWKPIVM